MLSRLVALLAVSFAFVSTSPARAQDACVELFRTDQARTARLGLPEPSSILNDIANGRELPTGRYASVLQKLSLILPKDRHSVLANGERASLGVSYSPDFSNASLQLGSSHLIQTNSSKLVVSELAGAQGSLTGVDAKVYVTDGKLIITNSIFNGNKTTHAGLTRRDIRAEFIPDKDGGLTISVQQAVQTVSDFAPSNQSYETQSKITYQTH